MLRDKEEGCEDSKQFKTTGKLRDDRVKDSQPSTELPSKGVVFRGFVI